MIRLQQLSLMRGTKPLFESADLTINPGEKLGLIGANGCGKSTLFQMLLGELHPDSGEIDFPKQWRVAHVAQEMPALNRSAVDYVIDGDTSLRALESALEALESQGTGADGHRIAELHTQLADADAYTARSRAEQLLLGLGFSAKQFDYPITQFSGGWRMRLNLAQALMCPSELLLLDEPTNHLDLDAILWLEDWLKQYAGTMLVISHDRDFLDSVTNVIAHIDQRKLKRYAGNYSSFERQRAAQLTLLQSQLEKQQRQRAHLQSFIDRFKAKATKAKQAQSRIKALARMEELAPLRAAAEFSFSFREPERAPNPLLVLQQLDAGYRADRHDHREPNDRTDQHTDQNTNQNAELNAEPNSSTHADAAGQKIILHNLQWSLQAGQRIGLLGVNGAGKSTLIKTIAGDIAPLSGSLSKGKGLTIGYFAQHQLEMLRPDDSPLMHLMRIAPTEREQVLRDFLGSFNFPGEMVKSPIAPFSGGEKARLALALIVWQRPNLLLLDEPTNHLDLETREALTEALAQFEGTLILVSHDRHLLRATTDDFLIVADGQLTAFDGDLDDYRDWLFKTRANISAGSEAASADNASPTDRKEQRRVEAQERQRLSNLRKPLEKRLHQIETKMSNLQQQKASIEAILADTDIYDSTRKNELKQLLEKQHQCASMLEQLETEWLQIQESLEQL